MPHAVTTSQRTSPLSIAAFPCCGHENGIFAFQFQPRPVVPAGSQHSPDQLAAVIVAERVWRRKKFPVPRDVLRAFCRVRQFLPTCPDAKGEWHILRLLTNVVQEAGTSCPSGLPGVDLPCLLRLHTGGTETWKSPSAATTRQASCSSFPTSTSRFGGCQQECDMQSIAAQLFRQYSDRTALCCSPLNCRPSSKRLAGPRRLQHRPPTLIGVHHARGLCDIQTSRKN